MCEREREIIDVCTNMYIYGAREKHIDRWIHRYIDKHTHIYRYRYFYIYIFPYASPYSPLYSYADLSNRRLVGLVGGVRLWVWGVVLGLRVNPINISIFPYSSSYPRLYPYPHSSNCRLVGGVRLGVWGVVLVMCVCLCRGCCYLLLCVCV